MSLYRFGALSLTSILSPSITILSPSTAEPGARSKPLGQFLNNCIIVPIKPNWQFPSDLSGRFRVLSGRSQIASPVSINMLVTSSRFRFQFSCLQQQFQFLRCSVISDIVGPFTNHLFCFYYCQPSGKAKAKAMPGRLYIHTK